MNQRVLELYSGVGGMHWAMKGSGVPFTVVAAIDINTTANQVYRHNFPETSLMQRNLESLSADEFARLEVNVLLASPPCQPFTRVGLKGDISDPRTKSFLHILALLPRLPTPPTYILIENVKGFEESETRHKLVSTLQQCQYIYQEFLLTPLQFGIPNSRLRYYLVAVQSPHTLPQKETGTVLGDFPSSRSLEGDVDILTVGEFLEQRPEEELNAYLLPPHMLNRFGRILDIVKSSSRKSCCFTKAYGHYVEGTGSVLQMAQLDMHTVYAQFDMQQGDVACGGKLMAGTKDLAEESALSPLQLRYFTPREVANLLCFPQRFEFPDGLSDKQKYRLLGNSLNVQVVTQLVRSCFFPKLCNEPSEATSTSKNC